MSGEIYGDWKSWDDSEASPIADILAMKKAIQGGLYSSSISFKALGATAAKTAKTMNGMGVGTPNSYPVHTADGRTHEGLREECDINCCVASRRVKFHVGGVVITGSAVTVSSTPQSNFIGHTFVSGGGGSAGGSGGTFQYTDKPWHS